MPSIDEDLLLQLYASGKPLIIAEQNNGYIWQNFLKLLYRNRSSIQRDTLDRVCSINTLSTEGKPQFIHSATYEELIAAFGLTPSALADTIQSAIASTFPV
jgi:hypothetical protein